MLWRERPPQRRRVSAELRLRSAVSLRCLEQEPDAAGGRGQTPRVNVWSSGPWPGVAANPRGSGTGAPRCRENRCAGPVPFHAGRVGRPGFSPARPAPQFAWGSRGDVLMALLHPTSFSGPRLAGEVVEGGWASSLCACHRRSGTGLVSGIAVAEKCPGVAGGVSSEGSRCSCAV